MSYCTNRLRCDCWARSVNLRNRSIDRTALLKNLLVVQQLVARAQSVDRATIDRSRNEHIYAIDRSSYEFICARSADRAGKALRDLQIVQAWICQSTDRAGKVLLDQPIMQKKFCTFVQEWFRPFDQECAIGHCTGMVSVSLK